VPVERAAQLIGFHRALLAIGVEALYTRAVEPLDLTPLSFVWRITVGTETDTAE
jgi:hypothetical protein